MGQCSWSVIGIDYDMTLIPQAPSLQSLELFVSAVDLGSVSKAARHHLISQPSASARIAELERLFQVKLIDSTPHGSTATDAGHRIYRLAKETLESADRLMTAARELSNQRSQQLRIQASHTIAEYLLPGWLGMLRQRNSTPVPELTVANSSQVIQTVKATGDLGFIESHEGDEELESAEVGNDELWVVVGNRHSWAKRRRPITPEILASWPLVLRERGSGTRSVFESQMAKAGFPRLVLEAEMGSTAAIKSMLALRGSAGILSKLAVRSEIEDGSLVRIEVPGLDLCRTLHAVWSRQKGISYTEKQLVSVAVRASQGSCKETVG